MPNIQIKAPLHMTINISGFCCLDCRYCYAQPFTGKYIPFEKILSILEEARQLGVFQIKIGGGEPLLHPNIMDLVSYAIDTRLSLAILTSLGMKNTRIVEELSKAVAPHRFINVQVSLDSCDPVVNDSVRGRGALVKKNLDIMLAQGVDLQIAAVITKYNVHTATEIIDHYYPRVRRFHFMNLMPTQKLCEAKEFWTLAPDLEDLAAFWRKVAGTIDRLPGDVVITENERRENGGSKQELCYRGCSAGITSCEVDSNLDVLACNIARRFVLGTLKAESLETVWNSPVAKMIRECPVALCSANLYQEVPVPDLEPDLA